ncbi:MAG: methionyl-tRNA formyltransferase [Rhodospirillales bacterium]|nr:methionyl-tRNA formyltransferase [Rhodospirillales bacterium]
MTRLRLAFLGTPDFAVPCLEALAETGHEIACVYSQPPRPAGRGQQPWPSPVQAVAEAAGWPVRHPVSLKGLEEQAAFAALGLDAAVVVAYGLILPTAILAAPRLGCLNLHASLLPRWRGAAPIQRALLAGDRETGVTIMQMDQGLDTGPMLLQEAVPIGPATTAAELHAELAVRGARMMVEVLAGLDEGRLVARPQPAAGATYAVKLERAEGRLDWRRPAAELELRVRALNPWPGTFAELPGRKGVERIKVLAAEVTEASAAPGELLDDRLTVACGAGALRLIEVQRAGKAAMTAESFLRGFDLPAGARLPLPEEQS